MTSIVYLQHKYPNLTETFVSAEIEELRRRGVDVHVVCQQINQEQLPLCPHADIVKQATSGDQLVSTISKLSPSYFHSHFVTECNSLGAPVAKHFNKPFGYTVHAYDIWKRGARLEPETIGEISKSELCKTAAAEGSKHAKWLEWCGVPKEKIIITPNSVDGKRLPPVTTDKPTNIIKAICVGRPVPKKGFFDAVDAIRLLRNKGINIELDIIGGADTSKPLGELVKSYCSHFSFVTASELQPHAEALKLISKSHMLLVPSIIAEDGDSDGIPTVLAEAMLMETPVVTTDVGSITDLVVDGQTGFISRSGDPASLAGKIMEVISLYESPEKLGQFLATAKRRASQQEIKASVDTLVSHQSKFLEMPASPKGSISDQVANLTRSKLNFS